MKKEEYDLLKNEISIQNEYIMAIKGILKTHGDAIGILCNDPGISEETNRAVLGLYKKELSKN